MTNEFDDDIEQLKIRQICEDPSRPIDKYSLHTYNSLLSLCIVTTVVLVWINYKVIKIEGTKNVVLILMLVALKLSLIAFAIFFGFQASIVQYYVCFSKYYYCMTGLTVGWPSILLSFALVLTMNKWIYYILYAIHIKYEGNLNNIEYELKLKRNALNLVTAVMILIFTLCGCVFSDRTCTNYSTVAQFTSFNQDILEPIYSFVSIIFFILSVGMIVTGGTFLYLLKRDHNQFYNEYYKILWTAVTLITIPLLLRCTLDWASRFPNYYSFIHKPNTNNLTTYNLLFFLFTTYIVILSQMATLVFGFVRYKQSHDLTENKQELRNSIRSSKLTAMGQSQQIQLETETDGSDLKIQVVTDDGSVSDDESVNEEKGQGYFNPPLQHYYALSSIRKLNRSTAQFGGDQFMIQRQPDHSNLLLQEDKEEINTWRTLGEISKKTSTNELHLSQSLFNPLDFTNKQDQLSFKDQLLDFDQKSQRYDSYTNDRANSGFSN